ncbi:MAG TPA: hypothetical protein VF193_11060 [Steroidobacter sp.]
MSAKMLKAFDEALDRITRPRERTEQFGEELRLPEDHEPACYSCGRLATGFIYDQFGELPVCARCNPDERSWEDRAADDAGIPRYGEI